MKPIQFRWIEAFQAIADSGSTIDAAARLGMDQSAVSRHLSALEGQLGITLFERRGRRLRLSSEGAQMLGEAETALAAMERFRRRAQEIKNLETGHLHLITTASLARGFLPAATRAFRRHAPEVTLKITVAARPELEAAIESQQFDLCAVALPFPYPAANLVRIGCYPGVCLLPRDHPLAGKKTLRLEDLRRETFVGLPESTIGRQRIDTLFREAGLAYRPTIETTAVALNELVAAGAGLLITDPFTARSADRDRTVVRPLVPTIEYEYAFLFPSRRKRARLAERFVESAAPDALSDGD